MEKERLSKKQIIPLVIGVLTMIILVSSATYAYFKVSIGNTATSTTITGDIGGDTIGTVTLSGGGTNLYLGVSADDMSESNKGTIYYSSTTEGSRETNVNNAGKTTYTATLSGDETDEIMYACDYEFTVTSTGTALGKEHTSDISVVFEGDIKKTIPLSASETVSGTWFGFKNSNKERSFNAYLQLENKDSEQNSLAGTNLSVEISNTKWNCYLSELDELIGEAYALYTESNKTLTFVRSETPIKVGDTYNDVEITNVYTGFEEEAYFFDSASWMYTTPWNPLMFNINSIIFEDEIRPVSTAYWFTGVQDPSGVTSSKNTTINLNNLNTALVTDMTEMFSHLGDIYSNYYVNIIGIENLNTSNVINMSNLFAYTKLENNLNLSKWDVSNVTIMDNLFYQTKVDNINLDDWDVSNVTDMSYMFASQNMSSISNISDWNVSNVTNMQSMFLGAYGSTVDLSRWNVSNVTNMQSMFDSISFTSIGDITKWKTGNVVNMTEMFANWNETTFEQELDLRGWDVSNVTAHNDFTTRENITPPIWDV